MANTIRPRAYIENGIVTVKALISHPMETGLRKDKKSGKKIPAHFIKDFIAELNDEIIISENGNRASICCLKTNKLMECLILFCYVFIASVKSASPRLNMRKGITGQTRFLQNI